MRRDDKFPIVPKLPARRSPFDVPGLKMNIARKEILEALHESREVYLEGRIKRAR